MNIGWLRRHWKCATDAKVTQQAFWVSPTNRRPCTDEVGCTSKLDVVLWKTSCLLNVAFQTPFRRQFSTWSDVIWASLTSSQLRDTSRCRPTNYIFLCLRTQRLLEDCTKSYLKWSSKYLLGSFCRTQYATISCYLWQAIRYTTNVVSLTRTTKLLLCMHGYYTFFILQVDAYKAKFSNPLYSNDTWTVTYQEWVFIFSAIDDELDFPTL